MSLSLTDSRAGVVTAAQLLLPSVKLRGMKADLRAVGVSLRTGFGCREEKCSIMGA